MFEDINLIQMDTSSNVVKMLSDKISENDSIILPNFITEKKHMVYIINVPKINANVGIIYLYDINFINRNAWIDGAVVDSKYKRNLVISYVNLIYKGMTDLKLNKISARHLVGDIYYKHIYDYLRFTLEGNLRDEVKLFGKFCSVQVRSLLNHEFNRYYLSGNHLNKMCMLEGF